MPYCRIDLSMKTTIDIPESLYKRAKFRCIEQGQTLREIVIASLQKELAQADSQSAEPYWSKRSLRPAYVEALARGDFSGGTGSTLIVSEDRDSREGALL
jgi:hypothetical protein